MTSAQTAPAVAVAEGAVAVVKVVVTVLVSVSVVSETAVTGVAAIVSVAVVAVTVQEAVVRGTETLTCVAVASPEPVVHEHSVSVTEHDVFCPPSLPDPCRASVPSVSPSWFPPDPSCRLLSPSRRSATFRQPRTQVRPSCMHTRNR